MRARDVRFDETWKYDSNYLPMDVRLKEREKDVIHSIDVRKLLDIEGFKLEMGAVLDHDDEDYMATKMVGTESRVVEDANDETFYSLKQSIVSEEIPPMLITLERTPELLNIESNRDISNNSSHSSSVYEEPQFEVIVNGTVDKALYDQVSTPRAFTPKEQITYATSLPPAPCLNCVLGLYTYTPRTTENDAPSKMRFLPT